MPPKNNSAVTKIRKKVRDTRKEVEVSSKKESGTEADQIGKDYKIREDRFNIKSQDSKDENLAAIQRERIEEISEFKKDHEKNNGGKELGEYEEICTIDESKLLEDNESSDLHKMLGLSESEEIDSNDSLILRDLEYNIEAAGANFKITAKYNVSKKKHEYLCPSLSLDLKHATEELSKLKKTDAKSNNQATKNQVIKVNLLTTLHNRFSFSKTLIEKSKRSEDGFQSLVSESKGKLVEDFANFCSDAASYLKEKKNTGILSLPKKAKIADSLKEQIKAASHVEIDTKPLESLIEKANAVLKGISDYQKIITTENFESALDKLPNIQLVREIATSCARLENTTSVAKQEIFEIQLSILKSRAQAYLDKWSEIALGETELDGEKKLKVIAGNDVNDIIANDIELRTRDTKADALECLEGIVAQERNQINKRDLQLPERRPAVHLFKSRILTPKQQEYLLDGKTLSVEQRDLVLEIERSIIDIHNQDYSKKAKPLAYLDTGEGKSFIAEIIQRYDDIINFARTSNALKDRSERLKNSYEEAVPEGVLSEILKIQSDLDLFTEACVDRGDDNYKDKINIQNNLYHSRFSVKTMNLANQDDLKKVVEEQARLKNGTGKLYIIDESLFVNKENKKLINKIARFGKVVLLGASENTLKLQDSKARAQAKFNDVENELKNLRQQLEIMEDPSINTDDAYIEVIKEKIRKIEYSGELEYRRTKLKVAEKNIELSNTRSEVALDRVKKSNFDFDYSNSISEGLSSDTQIGDTSDFLADFIAEQFSKNTKSLRHQNTISGLNINTRYGISENRTNFLVERLEDGEVVEIFDARADFKFRTDGLPVIRNGKPRIKGKYPDQDYFTSGTEKEYRKLNAAMSSVMTQCESTGLVVVNFIENGQHMCYTLSREENSKLKPRVFFAESEGFKEFLNKKNKISQTYKAIMIYAGDKEQFVVGGDLYNLSKLQEKSVSGERDADVQNDVIMRVGTTEYDLKQRSGRNRATNLDGKQTNITRNLIVDPLILNQDLLRIKLKNKNQEILREYSEFQELSELQEDSETVINEKFKELKEKYKDNAAALEILGDQAGLKNIRALFSRFFNENNRVIKLLEAGGESAKISAEDLKKKNDLIEGIDFKEVEGQISFSIGDLPADFNDYEEEETKGEETPKEKLNKAKFLMVVEENTKIFNLELLRGKFEEKLSLLVRGKDDTNASINNSLARLKIAAEKLKNTFKQDSENQRFEIELSTEDGEQYSTTKYNVNKEYNDKDIKKLVKRQRYARLYEYYRKGGLASEGQILTLDECYDRDKLDFDDFKKQLEAAKHLADKKLERSRADAANHKVQQKKNGQDYGPRTPINQFGPPSESKPTNNSRSDQDIKSENELVRIAPTPPSGTPPRKYSSPIVDSFINRGDKDSKVPKELFPDYGTKSTTHKNTRSAATTFNTQVENFQETINDSIEKLEDDRREGEIEDEDFEKGIKGLQSALKFIDYLKTDFTETNSNNPQLVADSIARFNAYKECYNSIKVRGDEDDIRADLDAYVCIEADRQEELNTSISDDLTQLPNSKLPKDKIKLKKIEKNKKVLNDRNTRWRDFINVNHPGIIRSIEEGQGENSSDSDNDSITTDDNITTEAKLKFSHSKKELNNSAQKLKDQRKFTKAEEKELFQTVLDENDAKGKYVEALTRMKIKGSQNLAKIRSNLAILIGDTNKNIEAKERIEDAADLAYQEFIRFQDLKVISEESRYSLITDLLAMKINESLLDKENEEAQEKSKESHDQLSELSAQVREKEQKLAKDKTRLSVLQREAKERKEQEDIALAWREGIIKQNQDRLAEVKKKQLAVELESRAIQLQLRELEKSKEERELRLKKEEETETNNPGSEDSEAQSLKQKKSKVEFHENKIAALKAQNQLTLEEITKLREEAAREAVKREIQDAASKLLRAENLSKIRKEGLLDLDIEGLEKECLDMEDDNVVLKSELEALQTKLQAARETNNDEDIAKLNTDIATKEDAISTKRTDITEKNTAINILKDDLAKTRADLAKQKLEVIEEEDKREIEKAELQKLNEEVLEKSKKENLLQIDLEKRESNLKDIETDKAALDLELKALEEQVAKAEAENEDNSQEVEDLKVSKGVIEKSIFQKDEEITEKKNEIKKYRVELEAIKEEVEEQKLKIIEQENEGEIEKTKLQNLRSDHLDKNKQKALLDLGLEKLEEQLVAIETDKNALDEELTALRAQVDTVKDYENNPELIQLKTDMEQMETSILETKNKIEAKQDEITRFEDSLRDAEDNVATEKATLKGSQKLVSKKITSYKLAIADLRVKLVESADEFKVSGDKADTLKQNLSDVERRLLETSKREDGETQESYLDRLGQGLAKTTEAIGGLVTQLVALQEQNRDSASVRSGDETDTESMTVKDDLGVDNLGSIRDQIRLKKALFTVEIDDLNKEIDSLTNKLNPDNLEENKEQKNIKSQLTQKREKLEKLEKQKSDLLGVEKDHLTLKDTLTEKKEEEKRLKRRLELQKNVINHENDGLKSELLKLTTTLAPLLENESALTDERKLLEEKIKEIGELIRNSDLELKKLTESVISEEKLQSFNSDSQARTGVIKSAVDSLKATIEAGLNKKTPVQENVKEDVKENTPRPRAPVAKETARVKIRVPKDPYSLVHIKNQNISKDKTDVWRKCHGSSKSPIAPLSGSDFIRKQHFDLDGNTVLTPSDLSLKFERPESGSNKHGGISNDDRFYKLKFSGICFSEQKSDNKKIFGDAAIDQTEFTNCSFKGVDFTQCDAFTTLNFTNCKYDENCKFSDNVRIDQVTGLKRQNTIAIEKKEMTYQDRFRQTVSDAAKTQDR